MQSLLLVHYLDDYKMDISKSFLENHDESKLYQKYKKFKK